MNNVLSSAVLHLKILVIYVLSYCCYQKLSERTAELQSGAESFADLANELARNMEKRKWWNF